MVIVECCVVVTRLAERVLLQVEGLVRGKRVSKEKATLRAVDIAARGKHELAMTVPAKGVLQWEFELQDKDTNIEFSLMMIDLEKEELRDLQWIGMLPGAKPRYSGQSEVRGVWYNESAGDVECMLEWDNSYSWMKGKNVPYFLWSAPSFLIALSYPGILPRKSVL